MQKEDFIFGTRAVQEAVNSNQPVDKILFRKGLNNELFHQLYDRIKELEIPFQFVPVEKLNRVTRKNHQGVIALLSPVEFFKLEDVLPIIYDKGKNPLLLILDQISDVRNFGAIIRTAECAGVDAVIISEKGSARISGDAVKTSAGALFNVPVCRVENLTPAIRFLKESGLKLVAATEKSDCLYTKTDMTPPIAIVMGSEEKGISGQILKNCDELVKIPVMGKIESLNVSVASSIMVYEAVRQRNIND
ncbi:MAG: 23S rRNA (guanosine(2251)-2'-O)-methyltransferase RlmB [Prolixibacteraceae bacterium]|nr:23S rRNA (guanosine(2251)-2'-O)-methyltransferase RlmB [Prolixibacteraceae bacterium]MBN2774688.1 23S rRNA (guanosine(2251)-2'-O)-methyltransferase RlmB [Prolixibacteraceae bacterium]